MNCWRCGAELSDQVLTCPECGSARKARTRRVRCRFCGKRSASHLKVCPFCGRDLKPSWPHRLGWLLGGAALIVVVALLAMRYVHLDIGGWRSTAAARLQSAANWLAEAPAVVLPTVILPPSPTATETPTATSSPTPTPLASDTPTSTPTAPPSPSPTPSPQYTTYAVRSGDTPASIALRFGVDVDALMQINGVTDPGGLQVNQELIIPLPEAAAPQPTPEPTETPATETPEALPSRQTQTPAPSQTLAAPSEPASTVLPTATPAAVFAAAAGERSYTVQEGDTLSAIALEFGISVQAIMAANDITDPTQLRPNQELIIPPVGDESVSMPVASPVPAKPTAEPTATPTLAPLRLAPTPVNPADGTPYSGGTDSIIELKWESAEGLAAEEEFVVHIGYVEGDGSIVWLVDQPQEQPLRESSWYVPDWLFTPGNTYEWYVQVERVTRDEAGVVTGERQAVSAPSEHYQFVWQ